MNDPRSRPQPLRAQPTIDAVLHAATVCAARGGLASLRSAEVATMANVPIGVIALHFGGIERLAEAVERRAIARCAERVAPRVLDPSPVARLVATGEALAAFALASPDEYRIVTQHVRVDPAASARAEGAERAEPLAALLLRVAADVQAAIDVGEMRPLPVQQVVAYLWALWSGLIGLALREDALRLPDAALRPMLAEAAEVLRRGLAPVAEQRSRAA